MNGFFLAIGKQGSGKTAMITRIMFDNIEDRPIFSNYTLFGLDYQKITLKRKDEDTKENQEKNKVIYILDKLIEEPNFFNNSIMLLDEIHLYLDSLDFMKKNNRLLQVFFSQLRKRNILLLATTQYILNVDIRIRRQCSNVFEMQKLYNTIFEYTTYNIDGYYTEEIKRDKVDLGAYYKLYDTNEIIS